MWCERCQHGHEPDEKGLCPCRNCGVRLVEVKKNDKVTDVEDTGEYKVDTRVDNNFTILSTDDTTTGYLVQENEIKPKKKRSRPRKDKSK